MLHKLSKYRGKEGAEPRINRLGSGAWNKMKDRTKSKLKDIARDLIKLYAARKDEKGYAYSPHGEVLQSVLERIVVLVGKHGRGNKHRSLLIVGSCLKGRTYSHLSRARSAKDVKLILADLAEGKIDILIGTHKIIGKDVKFKDLGLLIVDEEQKFGVAVKEKLKQFKVNVDYSGGEKHVIIVIGEIHYGFFQLFRRHLTMGHDSAIESFSELGSGIHIAMQDLDIRGAGNLLGAEQSGFIADLGYETYQRILKEAVMELKNEEFADTLTASDGTSGEEEFVADCAVESDMELLLPPDYVPQEGERISLYKELDGIERATADSPSKLMQFT